MGRSSKTRKHRHSSSDDDDDGDDTASSSSSSLSPSTSHKRRRRRKERNERSKRKRESKHRRSRRDRRKRVSESEDGSRSSTDEDSELRRSRVEPRAVVRYILKKFPGVATDLEQVCKFWILFRNPNFDDLGWILLFFFNCNSGALFFFFFFWIEFIFLLCVFGDKILKVFWGTFDFCVLTFDKQYFGNVWEKNKWRWNNQTHISK